MCTHPVNYAPKCMVLQKQKYIPFTSPPSLQKEGVRHSFKSHSTTPTRKKNTKHKCINPRRLVVYTKTAPFSARIHNRIGFRFQTGTSEKENRNVQNNSPRSDPHELTSKEYTQGVFVSARTQKCARNLHTSLPQTFAFKPTSSRSQSLKTNNERSGFLST